MTLRSSSVLGRFIFIFCKPPTLPGDRITQIFSIDFTLGLFRSNFHKKVNTILKTITREDFEDILSNCLAAESTFSSNFSKKTQKNSEKHQFLTNNAQKYVYLSIIGKKLMFFAVCRCFFEKLEEKVLSVATIVDKIS